METKDRFFSLYKLFWTVIYDLLAIGFISFWIFFQVKVLGNDVVIGHTQSARK